jgi:hypothetical protein
MSRFQDDRTEAQKKTHRLAVVGTDPWMSGWGGAEGGASYAAWAFPEGYESAALGMIAQRGDMKRIRVVVLDDYRPKAAHTHVYVFNPRRVYA